MPEKYILSIDQGTTGTHVALIDTQLKVRGSAYQEFPQHFPKPGWVEHDLDEIWSSVEVCLARTLKLAGVSGKAITGIGITNQRETTCLWERDTGRPVAPAIVWQDRRTAARCAQLKAQGNQEEVRKRTGLVIDPYFSATKLNWLLDHPTSNRRRAVGGELCFGTIDTWLIYKLSGHALHLTDVSNASRTLLMDLKSLSWDDALLKLFKVPRTVLPEIRASAEIYGHTLGVRALPDGIPIASAIGDQQAALFGQACFSTGDAKCTYGTGAFLLMNTGPQPMPSTAGLLSTVAWKLEGHTTYALEGSTFIAGAAVQWLRDGLHLIDKASDIEKLALQAPETGEVVFVPALSGLGAPHWRPEARGLLAGFDRSTTLAHIARAVLEGVAFQIYDLVQAMQIDARTAITSLKVDGGAAANNILMQFQADLLNATVVRPENLQTTGLGAAFLAGLATEVWRSPDEIRKVWKVDQKFRPRLTAAARKKHLVKWNGAVSRA